MTEHDIIKLVVAGAVSSAIYYIRQLGKGVNDLKDVIHELNVGMTKMQGEHNMHDLRISVVEKDIEKLESMQSETKEVINKLSHRVNKIETKDQLDALTGHA